MKLIPNPRPFVLLWTGLVLASVLIVGFFGLNYGIDFTGGTLLERGLPGQVTGEDVRQALAGVEGMDLNRTVIQPLDTEVAGQTVIIIRTGDLTNEQIQQIDGRLAESFGDVDTRRTDFVGPVVGRELIRQSLWALVLGALGILLYLTFRFEVRFGLAAVLGVTHDVLVTLAALALLRTEIDTPFVAAILTVLGYSLNNTIVIFDRIRENLSFRKKESLNELVNNSVRQTMTRTINTNLTTLFVLIALLLFGGPTIRDFTMTLTIGLLVGTFSSVFLAPSIWLILQGEKQPEPAHASSRA